MKWSDVGKSNLLPALKSGRADRALSLWRNGLALHRIEFFKCLWDRELWIREYVLMDKTFFETIAPFAKSSIYSSQSWLPGADKTDKDLLIQHASRGNMMVSKYWASYVSSFPTAGRDLCKEIIRKAKQRRWHNKGHNQKAKLNEKKIRKQRQEKSKGK